MLRSLKFGNWSEKLLSKLDRPSYRHAYISENVKTWIARQIRVIREKQKMSQAQLGEACGKPQSAIARLENPDYGKMTLQTLLEIAEAFDVALLVKFVDHQTFLFEYEKLDESELATNHYNAGQMRTVGPKEKHLLFVLGSQANDLSLFPATARQTSADVFRPQDPFAFPRHKAAASLPTFATLN